MREGCGTCCRLRFVNGAYLIPVPSGVFGVCPQLLTQRTGAGDDHIRHLYRVTPPDCNWRLQRNDCPAAPA
eukprot:scaffold63064_cov65-Phaeocystis_antarctica.AAC.1